MNGKCSQCLHWFRREGTKFGACSKVIDTSGDNESQRYGLPSNIAIVRDCEGYGAAFECGEDFYCCNFEDKNKLSETNWEDCPNLEWDSVNTFADAGVPVPVIYGKHQSNESPSPENYDISKEIQ